MNPYTILPRLNKPVANGPIDDVISVYAYKAVTAVAKAVDAIRGWHARSASIRALSRLDDHLLKDIGIDRSEIRAVVNGMPSRPPARQHRPALRAVTATVRARPAANDIGYAAAA